MATSDYLIGTAAIDHSPYPPFPSLLEFLHEPPAPVHRRPYRD